MHFVSILLQSSKQYLNWLLSYKSLNYTQAFHMVCFTCGMLSIWYAFNMVCFPYGMVFL